MRQYFMSVCFDIILDSDESLDDILNKFKPTMSLDNLNLSYSSYENVEVLGYRDDPSKTFNPIEDLDNENKE